MRKICVLLGVYPEEYIEFVGEGITTEFPPSELPTFFEVRDAEKKLLAWFRYDKVLGVVYE